MWFNNIYIFILFNKIYYVYSVWRETFRLINKQLNERTIEGRRKHPMCRLGYRYLYFFPGRLSVVNGQLSVVSCFSVTFRACLWERRKDAVLARSSGSWWDDGTWPMLTKNQTETWRQATNERTVHTHNPNKPRKSSSSKHTHHVRVSHGQHREEKKKKNARGKTRKNAIAMIRSQRIFSWTKAWLAIQLCSQPGRQVEELPLWNFPSRGSLPLGKTEEVGFPESKRARDLNSSQPTNQRANPSTWFSY